MSEDNIYYVRRVAAGFPMQVLTGGTWINVEATSGENARAPAFEPKKMRYVAKTETWVSVSE
jgi:hypothetical protein